MASPFHDGGRTQTMEMPALPTDPPRRRRALPWVVVLVLVAVAVVFALLGVIALAG
jgi:hypothetical protein